MMKKILTLLDPTPEICDADECAFRLARTCGADLTGLAIADVHAREVATAAMGIGTSDLAREARQEAVQQERQEACQSVALFAQRCAAAGCQAEVVNAEEDTMACILGQSIHHDLIIIGAGTVPGEVESEHLVIQLMRHAARPVLHVGRGRAGNTPGRVLAAIDSHPQSWKSLHMFTLLFPPELVDEMNLVTLCSAAEEEAALDRLKHGEEFVRARGLPASTICRRADPLDAIPELVGELDIDTVILGPYSRPTLERLFVGSVTRKLLETEGLSLFLYH